MLLDRTITPTFQTIESISFPALQKVNLDNNLPLHVINIGQQAVVRLDISFEAGTWYETTPNTAFFTSKMLSEGTTYHTSAQISEHFDGLGAFLELNHGFERSNLTVYGLTKHLEAILVMVREMIFEAKFPEKELENIKNTTSQGLKINLEKNAYIANIHVKEKLFGKNHPYGRSLKAAYIGKIDTETTKVFYKTRILNQPFLVFLSGKINETEISLVNKYLGQHTVNQEIIPKKEYKINSNLVDWHFEKPDAMQSSIRLGRLLFTRSHPDFFPFIVCNEVLGGYFGSRLMKNIREDKGFTYGISSGLFPMRESGYWNISTDVKKESKEATFREIEKEIKRLQTELVPTDELETAKNYMAGSFAGSLNTPFEIADRVRLIVHENLKPDYYNQYISKIRAITSEQVLEMANKYMKFEDLMKISVG